MSQKLLSFDPGGSSGWASVEIDGENTYFDGSTFSIDDHHKDIRQLIQDIKPDLVIYEQFEFRQKAASNTNYRKGLNLISREYIGVIRLVCWDLAIPTRPQPPSYKDTTIVANANLEKIGVLRTPLQPNVHYHDAMKHLIHFMCQTLRHQTTLDKLKRKNHQSQGVMPYTPRPR